MKYAFTLGLISLALVSAQYEHDENYNNMDNYDDNDFGYYQGGEHPDLFCKPAPVKVKKPIKRCANLNTKLGRNRFLNFVEKRCIRYGPKKIAHKEKKCKAKAKKRCTKKLANIKCKDSKKYKEKLTKCIAKKEKKCGKKAAKRTAGLKKSCKRMRRKLGQVMAIYFNPSLSKKFCAKRKARKAARKAKKAAKKTAPKTTC
ncbi:hypothetical protein BB559_003878 [Furculomyces boomerangus]|uniref:Extracellular membrane protein CFEM domain-containing protein n=2 Tax=Harpellales TaxID=61421 RepID=A0A2T9YID1_9FUNG|nr:hypothetical protein BB559_003878 [Furculomyces boomerangus]PWA00197.1 hypothetical protein BB558_003775 [Smittium angustum]PWA01532.1 hypothetical protein BB558_002370 [Smittium angustum]